ncbi:pirin family protein [Chryseosolibacter indicus]|uniref:Pirin family protein n=1 Tax=Chryseosolibacter indicus TaxID=2782351 RepID=A0ABS5VRZ8_9BACT|nr:pirin family protein [Chryseosolibacter indicus]MBT1703946.1 pirin family protein [Chryseosolibacter indicus]
MRFHLYKSNERGVKDLGWLKSNFSFSFSNYYDPLKNGFGLLKALNDDFVKPNNGFGLHAHMNMEIISIMLAGSMNHIDSMGFKEVVKKDWVQIMSAGSGLRHEEHNVGDEEVNFLQIWIEPKIQNITPRYQRRYFPEENRLNKLVTIVSNEEGQSHCWINQNAKLSLGYFQADNGLSYSWNHINKSVFIFNISGLIRVEGKELKERDAIGIWDTENIEIKTVTESRFLIIESPINH